MCCKYEVVKRWVTGERAVQSREVINAELEELMREYFKLSGQRKFFGHKQRETDLGGWKFGRIPTNAASNLTFIVVHCAIGPVARIVCEL